MNKPTQDELNALKTASDEAIAEANAASNALHACLTGRGYFGIPSNDEERAIWNQYNETWKTANQRASEATAAYMAAFDAFHAAGDPDAVGWE